MRADYAVRIRTLPPDRLEEFVNDWLAQRYDEYSAHELWRGPGDMGRDVTGYLTEKRMDGAWDNYQCKQLSTSLSEKSLFVELGKIFMHSAAGEFSLPRSYFFITPQGVTRAVQQLIAHPDRLRNNFLEHWDSKVSRNLVRNETILLTPEIYSTIEQFDFSRVYWFDAIRLANDPACKKALVKWFDDDPGPSPKGVVPEQIESIESSYIWQLLKLYEEKGAVSFSDAAEALSSPEFGRHLRDQRTRFFDSVAFDRFYRDSTPESYLVGFKDEVYHGVVDTHEDTYMTGLDRLREVMKQAASMQLPGVLGRHAGPTVKQGTCHQFANEGVLPWCSEENNIEHESI